MNDLKIVSCNPAHTEIIAELGKAGLIIAKSSHCKNQNLENCPIIGTLNNIDFDLVKELNPSLIFTSGVIQAKLAHQLKDMGFNVYHSNPSSLKEIYDDILEISKIINCTESGEKLISQMKSDFEKMQSNPPNKKTKIYIEEWHDPPTVSGKWIPELIDIAGGKCDLIEAGKSSSAVSIENLFKFDPEKIIITWSGFGKKVDIIEVLHREGWDSLTAIKNKEVYVIDDSLINVPSPKLSLSAKILQDILIGNLAAKK